MSPEIVKMIIEKACLNKSNLTEETANRIVDQAAMEGLLLFFYKCPFCSSYHMTKKAEVVANHLEVT